MYVTLKQATLRTIYLEFENVVFKYHSLQYFGATNCCKYYMVVLLWIGVASKWVGCNAPPPVQHQVRITVKSVCQLTFLNVMAHYNNNKLITFYLFTMRQTACVSTAAAAWWSNLSWSLGWILLHNSKIQKLLKGLQIGLWKNIFFFFYIKIWSPNYMQQFKKKKKKIWFKYETCISWYQSRSVHTSQSKWEDPQACGTETETICLFIVIYLSVAGFTINSLFFTFLYKVIIGGSDFHNYDSYTVEMTKAASANRSVHVDQQLVRNSETPPPPPQLTLNWSLSCAG